MPFAHPPAQATLACEKHTTWVKSEQQRNFLDAPEFLP